MPNPTYSFAVILVSDFSLQALLRLRPDLTTKPVGLLDGDHRRAVITALTPRAHAAGVVPGLTVPQALSRCSDLLLEQIQPSADDEASASLLAAASTLSPLVEDTALGIATADVTSLPTAERQPRLQAALTRLATLGLTATAGLAPTPLLALYAARNLAHSLTSSPCFPPTAPASKIQTVSNARAFLAPLPLSAADPDPAHVAILRLWGISTLGQLTALAKADVAQRLGPGGLALWERAAGESTRPIQPLPPPRSFAAEMELEHVIESLEPLLFLLRRFVDRLCLDLQSVALAAAELDLCLRLDDDKFHQRSIRLPEPTASPDILFNTLQSHLETVQTDAAIVAIRLELFPTRPLHRQQGLFDSGLRDPHGFAETLARAAALLGSDRVGTPQLVDSHRPDSATLVVPSTGEAIPPIATSALPALGIPLRRYRPPLPARVELSPHSRAPAYVWSDRVSGEVQAHHGPWRASGDWWQPNQTWAREEWDIALAPPKSGLYRLTETPTGWYLDGEYD